MWMMLLRILVAILLFGLIIFVHEFGHFIAAKSLGVKVNEFALGMGPKILSFGKGETKYSWRLFPIGGYCAMEGEDEASPDPRSFSSKRPWRRAIILVAGVVMNFVLGYLVLLGANAFCTPPNADGEVLYPTTTVFSVPETASSYQGGLRSGDTIVGTEGKAVFTSSDLISLLQSSETGTVSMTVTRERDGGTETVELPAVTFEIKQDEETGARYLIYDFVLVGEPQTVLSTITYSAKMEWSLGTAVFRSLGDIVTGKYGLNDLSGPIGTVDYIGDAVENAVETSSLAGVYTVLMLLALITVNVGVFNLLPLPALDGGRLIFVLFEMIFRKPIPQKYESIVHLVGFVFLILLMIVITFSDVWKLIAGV